MSIVRDVMQRLARRVIERDQATIEVVRITRDGDQSYVALVAFEHASASWDERVRFTFDRTMPGGVVALIEDDDYPSDRQRVVRLASVLSPESFITDFLTSGRW